MGNGSEPIILPRSRKEMEVLLSDYPIESSGPAKRSTALKFPYGSNISATYAAQSKSASRTWHGLQARLPVSFGLRRMSTGGISRKDYLWGISGSRQTLQQAQSREQAAAQEQKAQEPDFFAQLKEEGYSNIQEALQRVIIGAYQLLQDDRVDQAESMVDEGSNVILVKQFASQDVGAFRINND